jgi:membrane protease YdiL (CAAX protease family)
MGVLPGRTARFEAFVAPARAAPALWRLGAGAGLAGALWMAVAIGIGSVWPWAGPRAVLVLYLASFVGLAAGLALAVRLLHRRAPRTLIGPAGFSGRGFALGMAVIAVVALFSLGPAFAIAPVIRQWGFGAWAAWLPVALPALLVQTGAEELAFRGYLMQGLAARFRSPAAWFLLPAALFGALHYSPAEFGRDAWLAALSAGVVGLVLADVTVRTGNLSVAIGLHFANNVVAMLVLALPSPVGALSLYLATVDDPAAIRRFLVADLATTLVAYAAWRAVAARRRRLQSRGPGSI